MKRKIIGFVFCLLIFSLSSVNSIEENENNIESNNEIQDINNNVETTETIYEENIIIS